MGQGCSRRAFMPSAVSIGGIGRPELLAVLRERLRAIMREYFGALKALKG